MVYNQASQAKNNNEDYMVEVASPTMPKKRHESLYSKHQHILN